ncbi:MAG: hypothetical protein H6739_32120 [Alphaproteobacteria bacterium]|nr:hypothetical protein [Alphaproteobacteria bacterium]
MPPRRRGRAAPRVVITGLGVVCPLAEDPAALHEALCAGRSALGPGPYPGEGRAACLPGRPAATAIAAMAALRAVAERSDREDIWVVCGSSASDLARAEPAWGRYFQGADAGPDLLWPQLVHRPAEAARRAIGSRAPAIGVSTACTSGATALAQAVGLVEEGTARAALAIGVDVVCQMTWEGFGALGLRAPGACRPFDRRRDGLALGDAAAALLVERLDDARARGARVRAEVLGVGGAADGLDLAAPDPQGRGLRRAIRQVLDAPPPVVIAHATGTVKNDAAEARALAAEAPGAHVTALKGALGHTLGAAAAVDAVVAVRILETGRVPPVVGLEEPDVDLSLVRKPLLIDVDRCLTASAAFGGGCAAILLGRV